jgi:predicted nucleic acid-binding protein
MPELLLPDTSSLIFLGKIGRLEMLRELYAEVVVTKAVVLEHIIPLPDWVKVTQPLHLHYQELLEQSIDRGEASIIALAMERKGCVVSLDDLKARKLAKSLGLRVTGTLGLLHKGKMAGLIPSIRETLTQLKSVDFRVSEEVETEVLWMSGEL